MPTQVRRSALFCKGQFETSGRGQDFVISPYFSDSHQCQNSGKTLLRIGRTMREHPRLSLNSQPEHLPSCQFIILLVHQGTILLVIRRLNLNNF